MLTREEVVQKMEQTDMLETAAKLFNLTLVAVQSSNFNKSGFVKGGQ